MNEKSKFVTVNTSIFDALDIYSVHRKELTAEDKERLITLSEASLERAVSTLNLISGLLEDRQNLRAEGDELLMTSDGEITVDVHQSQIFLGRS